MGDEMSRKEGIDDGLGTNSFVPRALLFTKVSFAWTFYHAK